MCRQAIKSAFIEIAQISHTVFTISNSGTLTNRARFDVKRQQAGSWECVPMSAIDVGAGGWPALSLDDCTARLCAPGASHEIEDAVIDGIPTKVWKQAPATLAHLADHARRHGERTFLVLGEDRISYAAWYRAVAALAAHLSAQGVAAGDRVALAMRNLPEWPVAYFAAATIGAIVVPLNAWWTGEELAFALSDSGARVLLCDGERYNRLAAHPGALAPVDYCLVARAAAGSARAMRLEEVIGTPAH
jgi:non-ribosomal peptide synthetase component F